MFATIGNGTAGVDEDENVEADLRCACEAAEFAYNDLVVDDSEFAGREIIDVMMLAIGSDEGETNFVNRGSDTVFVVRGACSGERREGGEYAGGDDKLRPWNEHSEISQQQAHRG